MKCLTCHGLITNGNCGCSTGTQGAASVNIDIMLRDRDAEIARLNLRVAQLTSGSEAANLAGRVVEQDREIDRLRAALAAGPAALRAKSPVDELPGVWDLIAQAVEAAQEAAMKEGT